MLIFLWTWSGNPSRSTSCHLCLSLSLSRARSMSWRTARAPTRPLYLSTPPKASTRTASIRTGTRRGPRPPPGRPPAPWRPGCRSTRRTLIPLKERRSCSLSSPGWHSHRWAVWPQQLRAPYRGIITDHLIVFLKSSVRLITSSEINRSLIYVLHLLIW